MYNINDWVKIIDKKTQAIICAGKITKYKEKVFDTTTNTIFPFKAISIDGEWYFPENNSKFDIIINPEHIIVSFNKNSLPVNYSIYELKYYIQKQDSDIYRDWIKDELDPEVISLVDILNKFENIETLSSCSGHNIEPLWIEIKFSSLQSLCLILKIIYEKFPFDFILETTPGEMDCKLTEAKLKLTTTAIGEEAYKKAKEFAQELQRWAVVLY